MLALFVSCTVALAAVTSADPVADVADVVDDALIDDALTEDAPSAPESAPQIAPQKQAPVVDQERALPAPDAPLEEDPWPWATTIASGIGVVPGGIVGVVGTVIGGLGLAMIASGISQGGGGLCLAIFGVFGVVAAVPFFVVTSILMPIGVIIGGLLGGAFEERFAWPTAVGALAGFIPAAAAAASTIAAYVLLLGLSTAGTPQASNLAVMSVLGTLAGAMLFALATGPIAIAGGAAVESMLLPPEEDVVEEKAKPSTGDRRAPPPPPTEEAPREESPSTDEETPPPLLDPAMHY